MNKFCFGAIYNGRLWEKELGVSALKLKDYLLTHWVKLVVTPKAEKMVKLAVTAAKVVKLAAKSHEKNVTDVFISSSHLKHI